jgi:hypothetical protein
MAVTRACHWARTAPLVAETNYRPPVARAQSDVSHGCSKMRVTLVQDKGARSRKLELRCKSRRLRVLLVACLEHAARNREVFWKLEDSVSAQLRGLHR